MADVARVLSRYVDGIVARVFRHADVQDLAQSATVPVINALSDGEHPCQALADLFTLRERLGGLAGKRLVFVGDGNNVCASFVQAAARFGFELVFSGPETLDPDPEIVAAARRDGGAIRIERDLYRAVEGADAVVTDAWLSMHDDATARERGHNQLKPYQVTAELMDAAKPDAIFLHCLPAHREEEVTSAVFDGPQSVVFDEAENRLHVQKGILRWCLGAL